MAKKQGNEQGPKQAILYTRVSTAEQAEKGFSLSQQIEATRRYASQEGYEVVGEFWDPGASGATLVRPGLDALRQRVREGGVSIVLAQDRDRLAREPALLWLLRQELAEHGCSLHALNSNGDDSPEGQLTDGIMD